MNTEIWKEIKEYEGLYEVSTLGNVKGLTSGKILKPSYRGGYNAVGLSKNGKSITFPIHRLVALNFLDKIDNCNIVNHKNGNKYDNEVDNLEWTNTSGNTKHARDTGLISIQQRLVSQYNLAGEFIREYKSVKEASEQTGLPEINIYAVCYGSNKSSGGFNWKYTNFEKDYLIPDGKEIKDYPSYIITKDGEVYSKKTKRYLKYHINAGYKYVDYMYRIIE